MILLFILLLEHLLKTKQNHFIIFIQIVGEKYESIMNLSYYKIKSKT